MITIKRYGHVWVSHTMDSLLSSLPNYAGLYMIRVRKKDSRFWNIVYVGQSFTIANRLLNHGVLRCIIKKRLDSPDSFSIDMLLSRKEADRNCLVIMEKELIRLLNPTFNGGKTCNKNSNKFKINRSNKFDFLKEDRFRYISDLIIDNLWKIGNLGNKSLLKLSREIKLPYDELTFKMNGLSPFSKMELFRIEQKLKIKFIRP